MGSSERKLANAVGGKSARACDNCVRKRARWYCAADDAFLCQSCDSSVHSANPLARRHERVRLKTVSSISSFEVDESRSPGARLEISVPPWHKGLTRKPRTPRKKKHADQQLSSDEPSAGGIIGNLVPEICSEDNSHEENDEEHELLYRVPIFDPFIEELCTSNNDGETRNGFGREPKPVSSDFSQEMNHLHGFLPSEMDLAEFAADVESLLGKGLDNESFDMEGLGILDCDDIEKDCRERVKVEDDEQMINGGEGANVHHQGDGSGFIDLGRETFELNFDYEEEEDIKGGNVEGQIVVSNFEDSNNDNKGYDVKKIFLRLDYEGVISAWDDHKSPWTTGERPELDANECWPDCMGTCGTMHAYGEMGMIGGHGASMGGDGGREARVSRYREKRRTRLFSKKIRYEVRKLNAEKRPRMKGRFVKRANFAAPGFTNLLNK